MAFHYRYHSFKPTFSDKRIVIQYADIGRIGKADALVHCLYKSFILFIPHYQNRRIYIFVLEASEIRTSLIIACVVYDYEPVAGIGIFKYRIYAVLGKGVLIPNRHYYIAGVVWGLFDASGDALRHVHEIMGWQGKDWQYGLVAITMYKKGKNEKTAYFFKHVGKQRWGQELLPFLELVSVDE